MHSMYISTCSKWMTVVLLLSFHIMVFAAKPEPGIYTEDKLGIIVTPDQPQFIIRLKANPTTGYSWFLRDYDAQLIVPLKHYYEAPHAQLMGAAGYDVWIFAVKSAAFIVPQMTQMSLVYARPWDVKEQSKQVIFRIAIQK